MLSRDDATCYALRAPSTQLNSTFGCPGTALTHPEIIRTVYDVVLFGFEADVLEIRLVESVNLVKETILIESAYDHHGYKKPCAWKTILRYDARFSRFNNVRSKCLRDPPMTATLGAQPVDWKYEYYQQEMARRFVKEHLPSQSIVMFGHVDEIPSRSIYTTLATSHTLGTLPTNVAITNLHGHVAYAQPSIFGAVGHPYTMGSPLVTRAGIFDAIHPHGRFTDVWLVGGVHLTNYCYAGSRILKEWTATEARPDMMEHHRPACRAQVSGCRRAAKEGRPVHVTLPLLLNCSPHRFPEWWHRDDPRLEEECKMLKREL